MPEADEKVPNRETEPVETTLTRAELAACRARRARRARERRAQRDNRLVAARVPVETPVPSKEDVSDEEEEEEEEEEEAVQEEEKSTLRKRNSIFDRSAKEKQNKEELKQLD